MDLLEWTGGALDGDGCVMVRKDGRLVVAVKQAVRGRALLDALLEAFGGKVYAAAAPRSAKTQRAEQWQLEGEAASDFCARIAPHTRLKRNQFQLAAGVLPNPAGRADIRKARADIREALQRMKREPHAAIDDAPSVAYAAGIVDTDGCICVGSVSVSQKWAAICEWLAREHGGYTYAYAGRQAYDWRLSGPRAVEFVRGIRPHLRVKHAQADLVLGATDPASKRKAAEEMRALKGNQRRAWPPDDVASSSTVGATRARRRGRSFA